MEIDKEREKKNKKPRPVCLQTVVGWGEAGLEVSGVRRAEGKMTREA